MAEPDPRVAMELVTPAKNASPKAVSQPGLAPPVSAFAAFFSSNPLDRMFLRIALTLEILVIPTLTPTQTPFNIHSERAQTVRSPVQFHFRHFHVLNPLDVCRLRLDFETFNILGTGNTNEVDSDTAPDGTPVIVAGGGVCQDTFDITVATGQRIPQICRL